MYKLCIVFALTLVAGVAALQDGASAAGEAAPEPYSFAYQTDSHAASEQKDQQGRVTGFYTLTDADGRERRVDYVADENGFRAKVATNEVGTKSESPANVEMVAAEPTPAQYSYVAQSYQQAAQAAPVQASAQFSRQTTFQAAPQAANFGRAGYFQQQQYVSRPAGAAYGTTGYYATGYNAQAPANAAFSSSYNAQAPASAAFSSGYNAQAPVNAAYGSSYNAAYGGYGANGQAGYAYAPATYGYVTGAAAPAYSQYSYRSSSVGAPVATSGYTGTYRYRSAVVPAGGVTTYSTGAVPVGTVSSTYSSGVVPVGAVSTYSSGAFPAGVDATYSGAVPAGVSSSSSRSSSYRSSGNYLVLQKRAAEEKASNSN